MSTGRIDPPFWFGSYGWQGYSGQGNFLEFGKTPYKPGETGGIHGHVVYASTRPFDDPTLLLQNSCACSARALRGSPRGGAEGGEEGGCGGVLELWPGLRRPPLDIGPARRSLDG